MRYLAIAESILKEHEGFRSRVYTCPAGRLTVGYGRNLEDRGITVEEGLYLLANDILECEGDLASMPYWNDLSDTQKAALIDMRFCLGHSGYRQFKKMHGALLNMDYAEAAAQVMDSRFAAQVKGRAQDIADMLMMDGD